MTDNVRPLRGNVCSMNIQAELTQDFARCVDNFQEEMPATGALWVVFDDKGKHRVGWTADKSALPAGSILGMGIAALTKALS